METGHLHERVTQPNKHVALALSGGGFKSVADQSGMTAGLLAVLMKRNPDLQEDPSPLASSTLFDDVFTITSTSGGAWFASSLAYSKSFRIMIEDIARAGASNQESSDIFNSKYSKKFNDLTKNVDLDKGPKFLKRARDAVEKFHPGGIPESMEFGLLMATYFYQQQNEHPVSWSSFVKHILMDDAGETMGSSVQEWAVGKGLAIVTSIISPIPGILPKSSFDRDYIWYKSTGNNALNIFESNYLLYNMRQPKSSRACFIPARFSIILGASKSTPAPLPYGPSMLDSTEINYKGACSIEKRRIPQKFTSTSNLGIAASFNDQLSFYGPSMLNSTEINDKGTCSNEITSTSNLGIAASYNDELSFYDTPICHPVAASSAVVGLLTMITFAAKFFDKVNLNPGVFFASNLIGGEAFDEPMNLIHKLWTEKSLTQHMVDQAASMSLYELTDGGATDAFGVATALAAGATDIFAINAMSSGFSVACHFDGFQYTQFGFFGSVGKVSNSKWPISVWKLFAEDQHYYNKQVNTFKKLKTKHLPEDEVQSTSHLKKLSFGSMKATTVENKYFGIEGGRLVNLHVFLASGNVTVGHNQLFNDYGFYIQDIVATLTNEANEDIVNQMLDALQGKSIDVKVETKGADSSIEL